MRYALLVLLMGSLVPGLVTARTWHVAQDGSGDFTMIQDAVDVADDGDVIEIGPGRYLDYQTIYFGLIAHDIYVWVPEGVSLTFRGAGPEQTIIGPISVLDHTDLTFGFATLGSNNLAVSDLAVENTRSQAIYQGAGAAAVENCRFQSDEDWTWGQAIRGGFTGGASIRGCVFVGWDKGIASTTSGGAEVLVEGCEFLNCTTGVYGYTSGASNFNLRDSYFECEGSGIAFLDYSGGVVSNCHLIDCRLALSGSGEVLVTDNTVLRSDGGLALLLNEFEPVTITGNIFQTDGIVVRCLSGRQNGSATIRGNHFLRTGDDYWIYCPSTPGEVGIPVDFSLNYWGTTDIEEIAAGIWDCEDADDAWNCVTFLPIADGPVRTEPHSWSSVKAMFEDGED